MQDKLKIMLEKRDGAGLDTQPFPLLYLQSFLYRHIAHLFFFLVILAGELLFFCRM